MGGGANTIWKNSKIFPFFNYDASPKVDLRLCYSYVGVLAIWYLGPATCDPLRNILKLCDCSVTCNFLVTPPVIVCIETVSCFFVVTFLDLLGYCVHIIIIFIIQNISSYINIVHSIYIIMACCLQSANNIIIIIMHLHLHN